MIAAGVLFIVLGALVKYGKMYFLIAGYNTSSAEEKSKIDIDKLGKFFGNVMFAMAIVLVVADIIDRTLGLKGLEAYILYPTVVIGVVYLLIVGNSDRFKHSN